MAAKEPPSVRIERLLAAGDHVGAFAAAEELLRVAPSSAIGRFGRARALLRMGNQVEAARDLDLALAASPKDEHVRLVKAKLDFRVGRTEQAILELRAIGRGKGPHAIDAALNLLHALHYAGRYDELAEIVAEGGAWTGDPSAPLHRARVKARIDREAAVAEFRAIFASSAPLSCRRDAAFDAVDHLDKLGRYREAFDLAKSAHALMPAASDLEPWTGLMEAQLMLLMQGVERGSPHFRPRGERAPGTAFIVALPRSGTTLIEQMLDRHPEIGGIGEYDGIDNIRRGLFTTNYWPRNPNAIADATYAALRTHYLAGAAQLRKAGATWTLDKSLQAFRALPEIAMLFPGAVCISVDRDPRDTATSLFLSHLNPNIYGWASNFNAIRRVIETQRKVVPRALEMLGLTHERIVYERLVEDPAGHAQRCLARMGLAMDERVLAPEGNTRTAATLSHAQVRQPINRKSIGRWKNYEWAFDASWNALADEHALRLSSD